MIGMELDVLALLTNTMRNKIVETRKKTGMSIKQMAEKCGLLEKDLIDMENGKKEVTPEILAKILDVANYFQSDI